MNDYEAEPMKWLSLRMKKEHTHFCPPIVNNTCSLKVAGHNKY